jgi:hypothetical protein
MPMIIFGYKRDVTIAATLETKGMRGSCFSQKAVV